MAGIQKPRLIVCEGPDDKVVYEALVEHVRINETEVRHLGGKDKWTREIEALVATPGFDQVRALIAVRDADNSRGSTFQSVCTALERGGLPIPRAPEAFFDGKPSVAVFIQPPGADGGELEDWLIRSVRDNPRMACVDEFLQCVDERTAPGEAPRKRAKAQVGAFLAAQREPGKRIGEAAKARMWPFEHEVFHPLTRLLRELGAM